VRGNVDAISRILPDLVPHRAHRKSEHARGVGAIAVAALQRLQHELALDRLDVEPISNGTIWCGEREPAPNGERRTIALCLPCELLPVELATSTCLWLNSLWLYVFQVTHDSRFF
jgi:hypothetical protein